MPKKRKMAAGKMDLFPSPFTPLTPLPQEAPESEAVPAHPTTATTATALALVRDERARRRQPGGYEIVYPEETTAGMTELPPSWGQASVVDKALLDTGIDPEIVAASQPAYRVPANNSMHLCLQDLQRKKAEAVERDDLPEALRLRDTMRRMLDVETDLVHLDEAKRVAVKREDFDAANELKRQMAALDRERTLLRLRPSFSTAAALSDRERTLLRLRPSFSTAAALSVFFIILLVLPAALAVPLQSVVDTAAQDVPPAQLLVYQRRADCTGQNEVTGVIPPTISSQLPGLVELKTKGCDGISGTLPPTLGNLNATFETLTLSSTKVSGTFPDELGALTKLKVLRLFKTLISGTFPETMKNMGSLEEWTVAGSRISGTLSPALFAGLSSLQDFRCDNIGNRFQIRLSGTLPASLFSSSSFHILDITNNVLLSGTLPTSVYETTMMQLEAGRTKLSGTLSTALRRLERLSILDVSSTKISGNIPGELFALESFSSERAALRVSDSGLDWPCAPGAATMAEWRKGPSALDVGNGTTLFFSSICDRIACDGPDLRCFSCAPGYYQNLSGAASLESPPPQASCAKCENGRFSAEFGQSGCATLNCAVGKFGASDTAGGCVDCGAGTYADESSLGACLTCRAGTFSSAGGKSSCSACSPGTTNTLDSKGCRCVDPCPPPGKYGQWDHHLHQARCDDCPRGRYSASSGLQTAAECTNCTIGRWSNVTGAVSRTQCTLCETGKYGDSGGASDPLLACKDCVLGLEYTDQRGQLSCLPTSCGPGTWGKSPARDMPAACSPCAIGRVSPASGLSAAEQCSECPSGTYSDQTGQRSVSDSCKSCVPGHFNSLSGQSNVTACRPCVPGQFQSARGQASCSLCVRGRYSDELGLVSGSQCKDCPVGRFGTGRGLEALDACSACPPGHYGVEAGALSQDRCSVCRAGKFQDQVAQTRCTRCSAGKVASSTGTVSCLACLPGRFSRDDATACDPCPRGRYCQSSNGDSILSCEVCPAGTYQDESGMAVCKPGNCPRGRYGTGMTATAMGAGAIANCTDCPKGRYNPAVGTGSAEGCEKCPSGRFSNVTGAKQLGSCKLCAPGFFGDQDALDTANCSGACAAGMYSLQGMRSCLRCATGRITPTSGSATCGNCPEGWTTHGEGASNCVCAAGRILDTRNASEPRCVRCPDGVDCSHPGVSSRSAQVKAGFWRTSDDSIVFLPCPVPEACVGASPLQRVSGANGSASGNGTANTTANFEPCARGHEGPLCMVCKAGWTRRHSRVLCEACPESTGLSFLWALLFAVLGVIALLLFLRCNRKAPSGVVRPFMNAVQKLLVVLLFPVRWPKSVEQLNAYVVSAINFDLISVASPSCLGLPSNFYWRFVSMLFLALLITGGPWLVLLRYWRGPSWKYTECKERRTRDMCILILLLHPVVSGYAFHFFNCVTITMHRSGSSINSSSSGGAAMAVEVSYLMSDYSIKCYDDVWHGMLALTSLVIVFFSCGTPMIFIYLLKQERRRVEQQNRLQRRGTSSAHESQLQILTKPYRDELYGFETVQMYFKLALWATLVFFARGSQFQLAAACLVCVVQLCVQMRLRPFSSVFKNVLEDISVVLTLVIIFGGLILNYLEVEKRSAALAFDEANERWFATSISSFRLALEIAVWVGISLFLLAAARFISKPSRRLRARMSSSSRRRRSRFGRSSGTSSDADNGEGKKTDTSSKTNVAGGVLEETREKSALSWSDNPMVDAKNKRIRLKGKKVTTTTTHAGQSIELAESKRETARTDPAAGGAAAGAEQPREDSTAWHSNPLLLAGPRSGLTGSTKGSILV